MERSYLWSSEWIINAIIDAVELQKGQITQSCNNVVRFSAEMYGKHREYEVSLTDLPRNRCKVLITEQSADSNRNLIIVQFALLESFMLSFNA